MIKYKKFFFHSSPVRYWVWALCLFMTVGMPFSCPAAELYDQPPFTSDELLKLVHDLPRFRTWLAVHHETAHPVLSASGKPGFLYSPQAAQEAARLGWKPERFFCVMGRAAAALAIIEQGTAITAAPPPEMPPVQAEELESVRIHLASLLQAIARPVGSPGS